MSDQEEDSFFDVLSEPGVLVCAEAGVETAPAQAAEETPVVLLESGVPETVEAQAGVGTVAVVLLVKAVRLKGHGKLRIYICSNLNNKL